MAIADLEMVKYDIEKMFYDVKANRDIVFYAI